MSLRKVFEISRHLLEDWPDDPREVEVLHDWFETLQDASRETHLAGLVVWLESALVVTSRPGCMDEDTAIAIRMSLERLVRMLEETHPDLLPAPSADGGVRRMNDMLLGEILCQLGMIEPETAGRALRRQSESGLRFGETLIEMGEIGHEDLDLALNLQATLSGGGRPTRDPSREARLPESVQADEKSLSFFQDMLLGEILVRFGKVQRHELDDALKMQRAGQKHLGQCLVELGTASEDDIADALFVQSEMREAQRP